ncbi:MAG: hypothetical protein G8345_14655 [Magnetococcales bacterium]|nr:hypothetical protein [Magnetococcales bacterium]
MAGIDITCPYCNRHFRIAAKHLRKSVFPARCSECKQIFNLDGVALLQQAEQQGERLDQPAFLCLADGVEFAVTLQEVKGTQIAFTLNQPANSLLTRALGKEKCSLRIGLHPSHASWEHFITFACDWVRMDEDGMLANLTTLPQLPWLVVEEHGLYLYVVRSNGALEEGWKPVKPNQIPQDTPLPDSHKTGLVLCGKYDENNKRMQFKPYPLYDLLTIQRIARERHLIQTETESVPLISLAQNTSRNKKALASTATLFQSFGAETHSSEMPEEYTEREAVKPAARNPEEGEEYTAREDTSPRRVPRQEDESQRSRDARLRWIAGRLSE